MKRDLTLCVEIMLAVEELCDGGLQTIELPDVGRGLMDAHLQLLNEAGLLQAELVRDIGRWQARRITWAGCEWLDARRPKNGTKRKARTPDVPKVIESPTVPQQNTRTRTYSLSGGYSS